MTLFLLFIACVIAGLVSLAVYTQVKTNQLRKAYPPLGPLIRVKDGRVHFMDQPAVRPDAHVVLFLHGASSTLRDPHFAFSEKLKGKVRCLFLDRPGHGWSDRSDERQDTIEGQADFVADFLDELGVDKVILHGHSFGGAVSLAFALRHPDKLEGLVFTAGVAFPWPGGINWYYRWAAHPFFGMPFTQTVLVPEGLRQIDCVTRKVFWPAPVPENFEEKTGARMVLIPRRFRANSRDVTKLRPSIERQSRDYGKIKVPTKIISAKKDQVLLPWVHSGPLMRALPHAELIEIEDAGHMPHQSHTDIIVKAIFKLCDELSDTHATVRPDEGNA